MDEDKYIKPKHRKLDKHFVITLNGKRVKILNYKIYTHRDNFEEHQVIELITKISNENLNCKRVNIIIEEIDSVIEITGLYFCLTSQPGLSRFGFRIESYSEIDKIIGS